MRQTAWILLGLLAVGAPAFGQEVDDTNDSHVGTFREAPKPVQKSKLKQEQGQKRGAGVPAVDLKNNAATQQDKNAIDPGVVPQADSDSAADPLDQPVVIQPKEAVSPNFTGTPYAGLREVERLARDGQGEQAAALASALSKRVAESFGDEKLQAELEYAGGVSREMASQLEQSAQAYQSASVLAGPSQLRLDSLYNQGCVHIERGELFYDQIEEVKAESMAADLVKSSRPDKEQLDTLPLAREEYQKAREALIAHMRIDWRDEDARANLEFVQLRLDKLADIESKRKDATTEQKSKEGKESEKTEEGDDSSKGDQENEEQNDEAGETGESSENKDQNQTKDAQPQEGEGAQDGDEDPNPESESQEDPKAKQEEQQENGREDDQTESDEGGATSDPEMSQEQVKLILDRLNELDEIASRMRAALYKARRIPVDRDW